MTMYEVWKAIQDNGGTAHITDIMRLTGNGCSSVEEVLPRMKRAGHIIRIGRGVYRAGERPERNCWKIVNGEAVQVTD